MKCIYLSRYGEIYNICVHHIHNVFNIILNKCYRYLLR